jgi:hypothetical protein
LCTSVWYFLGLGITYHEKSGNPGRDVLKRSSAIGHKAAFKKPLKQLLRQTKNFPFKMVQFRSTPILVSFKLETLAKDRSAKKCAVLKNNTQQSHHSFLNEG